VERYQVFGRTSYPEPLEFQGTLEAADHDAAARAALQRHGRRWVELVLLPEGSIHWILGPQPVGVEPEVEDG
jgi:1,2-phenylacetyl-CoA epoxidase PaaB subunit